MKFLNSFMKIIVAMVVIHGLVCVTMSYILAFQDHVTIAENLSQTMITEIIAPIIAYATKSTIENVSKYNNWIDRIKSNKIEYDNPSEQIKDGSNSFTYINEVKEYGNDDI